MLFYQNFFARSKNLLLFFAFFQPSFFNFNLLGFSFVFFPLNVVSYILLLVLLSNALPKFVFVLSKIFLALPKVSFLFFLISNIFQFLLEFSFALSEALFALLEPSFFFFFQPTRLLTCLTIFFCIF